MTLSEWANRLKCRSPRPDLPPILFLTDSRRVPEPESVITALPRGAGVILRDYDHPGRGQMARDLARLCRRRGLRFLVAGDSRLAAKVGADGLHLPEYRLGRRPPWRRPGWLVTAAAHDFKAILKAKALGADAVLLSPVFPTESHPGTKTLGVRRLAAWTLASPLPVYALGGIGPHRARRLAGVPLAGVAGVGELSPGKGRIRHKGRGNKGRA